MKKRSKPRGRNDCFRSRQQKVLSNEEKEKLKEYMKELSNRIAKEAKDEPKL